jgi:hypothetical protein
MAAPIGDRALSDASDRRLGGSLALLGTCLTGHRSCLRGGIPSGFNWGSRWDWNRLE